MGANCVVASAKTDTPDWHNSNAYTVSGCICNAKSNRHDVTGGHHIRSPKAKSNSCANAHSGANTYAYGQRQHESAFIRGRQCRC